MSKAAAALCLHVVVATALIDQRVQCPNESFFGYDSIKGLNQDMKILAETKNNSYTFNLCPNTIFDGSETLSPILNNSRFICGITGRSRQRCIILGGSRQIYLSEPNVTYVSFHGVTLSESVEYGVLAQGPASAVAEFFECQWLNSHGHSGVHIEYESNNDEKIEDLNAIQSELSRTSSQNGNIKDHGVRDNLFQHRRTSKSSFGMTVRIFNSTFQQIDQSGFQAISSAGNLYLFNVSMRNIQGGVLTNIKNGNASIESCHFELNDGTSIIRAVNSEAVEIRDTIIEGNNATGMVTAIASKVMIENCQFIGNHATRGGEVLAFSSSIEIKDSSILHSKAMASVFQSMDSQVEQINVYSDDLVGDFCPGVLHEDQHSACFNGGECSGKCYKFTGDVSHSYSGSTDIIVIYMLGVMIWVTYIVIL